VGGQGYEGAIHRNEKKGTLLQFTGKLSLQGRRGMKWTHINWELSGERKKKKKKNSRRFQCYCGKLKIKFLSKGLKGGTTPWECPKKGRKKRAAGNVAVREMEEKGEVEGGPAGVGMCQLQLRGRGWRGGGGDP